MLAIALMVFALRQVLPDGEWARVEKYVRLSFWGLDIGLGVFPLLAAMGLAYRSVKRTS